MQAKPKTKASSENISDEFIKSSMDMHPYSMNDDGIPDLNNPITPSKDLVVALDPLFDSKHIVTYLNFYSIKDKSKKEWVQGSGNGEERHFYCSGNWDNNAKRKASMKNNSSFILPGKQSPLSLHLFS